MRVVMGPSAVKAFRWRAILTGLYASEGLALQLTGSTRSAAIPAMSEEVLLLETSPGLRQLPGKYGIISISEARKDPREVAAI